MRQSIVSKSIDDMEQKIHHLQYVLFTLKGDSRLNALEEEVRLLWAASRSSTTWIFNGCLSGSNGHALIWLISLQKNGFKFMEFLWSRGHMS
ncbi:unnamed protein product [Prunus armeniaca]